MNLKDSNDLCDIRRARKTKSEWFTLAQKRSSGFIPT